MCNECSAELQALVLKLDKLAVKMRRLATIANDGQRMFGFNTILVEYADELEAIQKDVKT